MQDDEHQVQVDGVTESAGFYFLSIAEASQDCIRVLKPDGRLEYMNRRGQTLFDIEDFSTYPGRYWPEIWPAEIRPEMEQALHAAAAGTVASFRGVCPTLKGVRKYWDTVLSPVFDENGEVVRVLATSRDITAEVETRAFLDTIIDLLPILLLVKNADDGRYVVINRAAEETLGLSARDALGKNAFDLFPADEATRFTAEDNEVIRSGVMRVTEEEPITTQKNGVRYFTTKKLATYNGGKARHLVSIAEDVTERRAAAAELRTALTAAEQASSAKSAFLANMSHEIRTPLNGIVAGADLLSQVELPAKGRELVEIIRASGVTLECLLSDILDLARIESGRITIESAPFHAGDMVRSTASLSRLRADEKGVQLDVRIDPGIDGVVAGDMVRVRQVLTNLLSNAVKFTDHGRVEVSAERNGSGAARFVVTDTGVGFDATDSDRVFGRFQQADSSITRRFGGTGLGLAISRELVGLMGGSFDCESTPGVGSSFWFEIPLPPSDAIDEAAPASVAGASAPDHLLRVLLADDHPTNRKVVQLMLADAAEVVSVENGAEAVEAFAAGGFDLVLMDMQMPVMDGLVAVREIRRAERLAGSHPTPVIMLTANALPEHVTASLRAGADRHLEKPITAASLFGAIADVLAPRLAGEDAAVA